MSPLRVLYALTFLAPFPLWGQTPPELPPPNDTPVQSGSLPPRSGRPSDSAAGTAEPDSRSFLDAQSEADRRRILGQQQRTFQLEIDGLYAKALKAYCDTGYGDGRCQISKPEALLPPLPAPAVSTTVPPPSAAKIPSSFAESHDLPVVAQISGFGDDLSAILLFTGGKRLRVVGPGPNGPRSRLPDGESVVSIRPGEVLVSPPGAAQPLPLLFQGAAAYGGAE